MIQFKGPNFAFARQSYPIIAKKNVRNENQLKSQQQQQPLNLHRYDCTWSVEMAVPDSFAERQGMCSNEIGFQNAAHKKTHTQNQRGSKIEFHSKANRRNSNFNAMPEPNEFGFVFFFFFSFVVFQTKKKNTN